MFHYVPLNVFFTIIINRKSEIVSTYILYALKFTFLFKKTWVGKYEFFNDVKNVINDFRRDLNLQKIFLSDVYSLNWFSYEACTGCVTHVRAIGIKSSRICLRIFRWNVRCLYLSHVKPGWRALLRLYCEITNEICTKRYFVELKIVAQYIALFSKKWFPRVDM